MYSIGISSPYKNSEEKEPFQKNWKKVRYIFKFRFIFN